MHNKNTYSTGVLNFLLYPTNEGTFVAACRELCLIREGDDSELLKYKIMADAKSYLSNVISNKLGDNLLNQELPKEILDEFNSYRAQKHNEDFQKWITSIKELKKSVTSYTHSLN